MRKLISLFSNKISAIGKLLTQLFTEPWLRAYSGLFINISAAFFVAPFIGLTIAIPKSHLELILLIADLFIGIMFLLLTVKCEERLKR